MNDEAMRKKIHDVIFGATQSHNVKPEDVEVQVLRAEEFAAFLSGLRRCQFNQVVEDVRAKANVDLFAQADAVEELDALTRRWRADGNPGLEMMADLIDVAFASAGSNGTGQTIIALFNACQGWVPSMSCLMKEFGSLTVDQWEVVHLAIWEHQEGRESPQPLGHPELVAKIRERLAAI